MKKRGKLSVFVAAVLTLALFASPVSAATAHTQSSGIQQADGLTYHDSTTENSTSRSSLSLLWSYTSYVIHGISIGSGGASTVTSYVQAYSSSYKISGTMTLQKLNGSSWGAVAAWSMSGTGSASVSKSYTVSSGSYRVKTAVTVNGESVTLYSETKTY